MSSFDHLADLLLAAERASAGRAVSLDLFYRNEVAGGGGPLAPVWGDHSAPIGRIVAERGRICWIIAKGNDLTLSDVLAADSGVPRATFERIYQSAKAEGTPFCEKLARSDIIDVGKVRSALRRQAAGALATLARIDSQDELARSVAGIPDVTYDADFTFASLEMLQASIQHSPELTEALGRLPATFARLGPKLRAALCFRESEDSELSLVPVSCWGRRDFSLSSALELALQAIAATQPSDLVAAEIGPFPLITRDSEWWLCAYSEPHLSLFLVDTRAQYLKLLSSLIEERRA